MLTSLGAAVRFLTVVPWPAAATVAPARGAAYFPLVGLAIGGVLAAVAAWAPAGPATPFLVLFCWVVLTGGLHLDGFADCCDGLLAPVAPERRLTIMHDPRGGSFAVVGLVIVLLGKWSLIGALTPFCLLLPPVVGRWCLLAAAACFPAARPDGLGGAFKAALTRSGIAVASVVTVVVIAVAAWLVGPAALVVLPTAAATVWLGGAWAARRLGGGITGDVYGALCETAELASLLALVVATRG